jgi:hypothetical protein
MEVSATTSTDEIGPWSACAKDHLPCACSGHCTQIATPIPRVIGGLRGDIYRSAYCGYPRWRVPCLRRNRMGALQRHRIVKICAVWIVLLIVSPFTAPFATCDPTNTLPALSSASGTAAMTTPSAPMQDSPGSATPPPRFARGYLRVPQAADQSAMTAGPPLVRAPLSGWSAIPRRLVPAIPPAVLRV